MPTATAERDGAVPFFPSKSDLVRWPYSLGPVVVGSPSSLENASKERPHVAAMEAAPRLPECSDGRRSWKAHEEGLT